MSPGDYPSAVLRARSDKSAVQLPNTHSRPARQSWFQSLLSLSRAQKQSLIATNGTPFPEAYALDWARSDYFMTYRSIWTFVLHIEREQFELCV